MSSNPFLKELTANPSRMKGMKIEFNGRKYDSMDDMPEGERAALLHALQANEAHPEANRVVVTNQIDFNGRTYSSLDEMSASDRKLYEMAMQMVGQGGGKSGIDFNITTGVKQDVEWTPLRIQLILVLLGLAALIWFFRDWFIQ